MATIEQNLQAIRTAVYGEEVRGSIVDAISKCYTDTVNGVHAATTAAGAANTAAQDANDAAEAAEEAAEAAEQITQDMAETIEGIQSDIDDLEDATELISGDVRELKSDIVTKAQAISNSASGSIVSFESDMDGAPLKSCVVEIEPVQDLHGYDYPWPAGGGSNKYGGSALKTSLLAVTGATEGTDYVELSASSALNNVVLYNTFAENQQYTLIFKVQPTGNVNTNIRVYYTDDSYANITASGDGQLETVSYTTTSGKTVASVKLGYWYTVTTKVYYDACGIFVGANQSFAPYSNICPISGHSSATVTRTGKNWFNVNDINVGKNYNGETNANRACMTLSVPAGTYTFSIQSVGTLTEISVGLSKEAYPISALSGVVNKAELTDSTKSRQYTVDSTYPYLYIFMSKTGITLDDCKSCKLMVERDSTASAYEPAHIQSVTIPFGQTVYGGVLDAVAGTLTVNMVKVDLKQVDFTAGDRPASVGGGKYFIGSISTPLVKNDPDVFASSEMYSSGQTGDAYFLAGNRCNAYQTQNKTYFRCGFADPNYLTTLEAFNAWKQAQSVFEIAFPLATPVVIENLDQAMITTLLGLNNVFASTGDITIEYPLNTKNYIDSEIEEVESNLNADITDLLNANSQLIDPVTGAFNAGIARKIISDQYTVNKAPFNFRKAFDADFLEDKIVGGTVVWNQLAKPNDSSSYYNPKMSYSFDITNNITIATVNTDVNDIKTIAMRTVERSNNDVILLPQNVYIAVAEVKSNVEIADTYFPAFGFYCQSEAIEKVVKIEYNTWTKCAVMCKTGDGTSSSTKQKVSLRVPSSTPSGGSFEIKNWMVINLTRLFGSTIADAIYAMETATTGAGVALFRNLFPNSYYAYDAGSLQSVQTSARKVVGFNQWDEEPRNGYYGTDGTFIANSSYVANKNPITVIPSTQYNITSLSGRIGRICWYDANNAFLSTATNGSTSTQWAVTSPANARYLNFDMAGAYGGTYKNDICINISDASRNGTYELYESKSYPLDSDLVLRGIPKLDSGNNLYYDGDVYQADGTVTRRYGIVDLGSLSWTYNSATSTPVFFADVSGAKTGDTNVILCPGYQFEPSFWNTSGKNKCAAFSSKLNISNADYTNADTFKTAMSGVYLVYELATPTTAEADPFAAGQLCFPDGTEEYIDAGVTATTPTRDVSIPVGGDRKYYKDFRREVREMIAELQALILEN